MKYLLIAERCNAKTVTPHLRANKERWAATVSYDGSGLAWAAWPRGRPREPTVAVSRFHCPLPLVQALIIMLFRNMQECDEFINLSLLSNKEL